MAVNAFGGGVDKSNIFLLQSLDGGATWALVAVVNNNGTTTDQWQPNVVVSPTGDRIGVFYYSRQEDPAGNNLLNTTVALASFPARQLHFRPARL